MLGFLIFALTFVILLTLVVRLTNSASGGRWITPVRWR